MYIIFCHRRGTSEKKMVAEGESAPNAALNLIKHARDFIRRKPSIAPFLIYSFTLGKGASSTSTNVILRIFPWRFFI